MLPPSRRFAHFVAGSALAFVAGASCGDDSSPTSSASSGGGSGPSTTTTTSTSTASSSPTTTTTSTSTQGQGGDGAGPSTTGGGQGGDTTSTSQGGNGAGGDTSSTSQGGNGGQGGDTTSSNQGGAGGQGGSGTSSNQGGAGGQGGSSGTASNQGGAGGQGGSGVGGAGGGPVCTVDGDCDDGASCSTDTCVAGSCVYELNHATCDDALFCTGQEFCDPENGADVTGCTAGSGNPCDDDVGCTVDGCTEDNGGTCTNAADDGLCDDGVNCNGIETCDAQNDCQNGTPEDCDDQIDCTTDTCSTVSGECEHIPLSTFCSDGDFCTGVEQCDPNAAPGTGCVDGPNPNCDDGFTCTTDSCDSNAGACVNAPNHGACGDGDVCDGLETCDPANGGAPGTGCLEGTPLSCSDGVPCTQNTCDPVQGCVFIPNDAACDDGSDCNGVDVCTSTGCQDGTPVICQDDGIPCTVEACDENGLTCSSIPNNQLCPPGAFCIPAQGGCVVGDPCDDADDCQDGDLCNGVEACVDNLCEPGDPVVCDDGLDCTFDDCNPGTGECGVIPADEDCDDGDACNGAETCDPNAAPGTGCVAGTPVVCNDAKSCTTDSCDQATGACTFAPNNAVCSNGNPCDGVETCSSSGPGSTGCTTGTPLVCPSDGIACTAETCVPNIGCVSTPNDNLCPCGQTCGDTGCGNFCQIGTCQGKVYACGDCLDNDGDCRIDSSDTMCMGPCDNTENSFYGGIPGQNNSPCKSDCYFDQDTGSGNDDCYWSHKCDPNEVAPNFAPEDDQQCAYNPNANIPGYSGSCATAFDEQSAACLGYCGPLTPNGCDCFGCCSIPGAPTTVWLGSEASGNGTCTLANLGDPTMCEPCLQVDACLNTCELCEICIGKPTLPPECGGTQQCDAGIQACGQPGQDPCPLGEYCITGCCQPLPD